MKRIIGVFLFFIFFLNTYSEQLTNYLGNEIFPVKRNALYFIKYSHKTIQIIKKDKNGTIRILLENYILPNGLDISLDEKYLVYVSNKEDARGVLKLYDLKKKRQKNILIGKSIDGVKFINDDSIVFSANGEIFIYDRLNHSFKYVDKGIHPYFYHNAIYYAQGNYIKKYDLIKNHISTFYTNNEKLFFPVIINDTPYFIENKHKTLIYGVFDGKKIPIIIKKYEVTTLNAFNEKIYLSIKKRNFDIYSLSKFGVIPLFYNELGIEKYPFKDSAEKLFAYERLIILKGIKKSIIKNCFLLSLKIKDIEKSNYYLELLKKLNITDYTIYNILYKYVYKSLKSEDLQAIIKKDKNNFRLMLIYGTLLFNEGEYSKALNVFNKILKNNKNYYMHFSTLYNIMKIYEKTGNIYENIKIWSILSDKIPIYLKHKYESIVINTFKVELIAPWEKLHILINDFPQNENLLRAKILYQLGFYDRALEELKNVNNDEANFLKFSIFLKRKELKKLANVYYKLKAMREKAKSLLLNSINLQQLISNRDEHYLNFLLQIFPKDTKVMFLYYIAMKQIDPEKLYTISKSLSKRIDYYRFKKVLFADIIGGKLPFGFIKDSILQKYEDPYFYFVCGLYEYLKQNYKKSKYYLLKSYNLSNNRNFYLNSLLLSYMAEMFYKLQDYDNMSYYLNEKFYYYNYFFNENQKINDYLLYAKYSVVNKQYQRAISQLKKLKINQLTLLHRIKVLSYIAFIYYIQKKYNDSLYYTLQLIEQKSALKNKNFLYEYKLLANIYLYLQDYNNALKYYQLSLNEFKNAKFKKENGLFNITASLTGNNPTGNRKNNVLKEIYKNLSIVYGKLGDYKKANDYIEKRINLLSKKEKKSVEMALIYNHQGYVYLNENKWKIALFYYNKSYKILKDNKLQRGRLENLINVYTINFNNGNFDEVVPFDDFKVLLNNSDNMNKNIYLLYLRTILELKKIKPIKITGNLKILINEYQKQFYNIIQLDKIAMEYLKKDINDTNMAFLYYIRYLIAERLFTNSHQFLNKAIYYFKKSHTNRILWYLYVLNGEKEKAIKTIENIYQTIPQALMPYIKKFLDNTALQFYDKGDYKQFIYLEELKSNLIFFNEVYNYPWNFASELDNIYYKNILYLKNNKKYDDLEKEMEENSNSPVNFFIKPYSLPVDELLKSFSKDKIAFYFDDDHILIYSNNQFIKQKNMDYVDYIIDYGHKLIENIPLLFSLNELYFSKSNFDYNPYGLNIYSEKNKKVDFNGIQIFNNYQGENIFTASFEDYPIKNLFISPIKPYVLILREKVPINKLKILSKLLFYTGFSTLIITNNKINNIKKLPLENKYKFFKDNINNFVYLGYRGIKKEEIENYKNQKLELFISLAIKSYREKKWKLSALYFQNVVNIYGSPFENTQKTKIFIYFLNTLYYSKEYDKGIYYIEKYLDTTENKAIQFKLYKYLLIFYNVKKEFNKSLKIAEKMGRIFKEKNYFVPILINQAKLLDSNGKKYQAYKIMKSLYTKYGNIENSETAELLLYWASLRYFYQKDFYVNEQLFQHGFKLDIQFNKGKNIKKYFGIYLLNEIHLKKYDIQKLIKQYKIYLDSNYLYEKCIAYLKSGDYYNFRNNVQILLNSDNEQKKISAYNLMGIYYLYTENYDKASKMLQNALYLTYKLKNSDFEMDVRSNLALLFILTKHYKKAYEEMNYILSYDKRRHKAENILYDLKLLIVLNNLLKLDNSSLIKQMRVITKESNSDEYDIFIQYEEWKLQPKKIEILENLVAKNTNNPLKLEILYQLSLRNNKYFPQLLKVFRIYYNENRVELLKSGVITKTNIILAYILKKLKPQKGLLYYYQLYYPDIKENNFYQKLKPDFDYYQFIITDKTVFRYHVYKNQITKQERDFDIKKFKNNLILLINKIKNIENISSVKQYFKKELFFNIKSKELNLCLDDSLLFLPFNIFNEYNIHLYLTPFKLNSVRKKDNVCVGENVAYENYFKNIIKKGDYFFFLNNKIDIKNIENEQVKTYYLGNYLQGNNLFLYDNDIQINLGLFFSKLQYLKHFAIIFSDNNEKVFYLIILRKLLENNLDYRTIIQMMKKQYTYEKYYSLMNYFIN